MSLVLVDRTNNLPILRHIPQMAFLEGVPLIPLTNMGQIFKTVFGLSSCIIGILKPSTTDPTDPYHAILDQLIPKAVELTIPWLNKKAIPRLLPMQLNERQRKRKSNAEGKLKKSKKQSKKANINVES
eukprot:TRINITY_DN5649_c0_g1_i2.p2 TRINITY_DN5649_c0_g1~~TRINITY_DN5649_c0_g1_i2.p2  ORF type:complete len:128 (-),score=19.39 TRINITY_DN5649_c0_g1_i2:76-459(-)